MKLLHLRRDPRVTRMLHDIARELGHEVHHAGNWIDLFTWVPDGPYQLAVLSRPRPTASDEQHCLHLSAALRNAMAILLITGDKDLAARLHGMVPDVFRSVLPTLNPHLLRQGIEEAAARARRPFSIRHRDEWQEIAPGIRLHRLLTRWTVSHGRGHIPLTGQEMEILAALLTSSGHTVAGLELARRAGTTGPLSANALQVAVRRLRDKVEADPGDPQHLLTVARHGYMWQP